MLTNRYIVKLNKGYYGGNIFIPVQKKDALIFKRKDFAQKAVGNLNRVLSENTAKLEKIK